MYSRNQGKFLVTKINILIMGFMSLTVSRHILVTRARATIAPEAMTVDDRDATVVSNPMTHFFPL